ncbi:LytR C-terminal domain-containing protein [Candidatus Oleimmundimicrobium sp.]|uniref:LCP family protein n=1 Tax=Candidatus Oleimmundimicrobium sp. TaxID=3060597 RepID=UPI0027170E02|nr:LytR C-terminal domain-containing protein [Candidatus Oleimmundimicrobium sp.]MDO8886153.1 LytR C-terminal domain-containing protein [Candidatus Oleimmundimicrobium sp.]
MDSTIKRKRDILKKDSRAYKRRERKRKNRRLIMLIIGASLIAFLLISGISSFFFKNRNADNLTTSNSSTTTSNKNDKVDASSLKPELGDTVIFLVMGVQKEGDKETVAETLALFCDLKEGIINGISVPKDVIIEIPGLGFEKVSEMLSLKKDSTAISAIQNLFGVEFHGYTKMNLFDLKGIMDKNDFEKVFNNAISSDIPTEHQKTISSVIALMDHKEDINILSLPVKSHAVGQEIYYEPDKKELEGLLARIWGVKVEKVEKARVMVLNGCGVPGVAGEVASKLINMGYQVVGTKNADNFKYEETQLLVYGDNEDIANNIKETLGVGTIIIRTINQDVTDIVVVVGRDYNSNEEEN